MKGTELNYLAKYCWKKTNGNFNDSSSYHGYHSPRIHLTAFLDSSASRLSQNSSASVASPRCAIDAAHGHCSTPRPTAGQQRFGAECLNCHPRSSQSSRRLATRPSDELGLHRQHRIQQQISERISYQQESHVMLSNQFMS